MTKILLIMLLVMQFLTAFSCNGSGSSKEEIRKSAPRVDNFNSYFPLKEGNNWKYVNEAPRDETELFDVNAGDIKKIDGGIQIEMSCFPYLSKDNVPITLIVKKDGSIEINDYMGRSGTIIPAQDNFKDGYEWKFGEMTGRFTVLKDTIVTEAGKFTDCYYVLLTEGFTFSFEMWFKKDVGIVKWGSNRTNPPVLKPIYYVLKEYSLR